MALGKYSITNHLAKPAGPVNDQDERHSRWQPARQIYEAVATDSFDASWTGISSMVYKLRRKLGAGIIETVRGHGYKFVALSISSK